MTVFAWTNKSAFTGTVIYAVGILNHGPVTSLAFTEVCTQHSKHHGRSGDFLLRRVSKKMAEDGGFSQSEFMLLPYIKVCKEQRKYHAYLAGIDKR